MRIGLAVGQAASANAFRSTAGMVMAAPDSARKRRRVVICFPFGVDGEPFDVLAHLSLKSLKSRALRLSPRENCTIKSKC
jgi:hypothetical protein